LVYDPIAHSADLFVDGIERLSDFTGFSYTTDTSVGFGSGSSSDTGQGNFGSVQFEVNTVPEPSSAVLWGLGVSFVGLCRLLRRPRREFFPA
jgi:hypothetical protein